MRRRIVLGLAVVSGVLALGVGARLAVQGPLPDVDRLGPQVGERPPDFGLVDQEGRTRDLASILRDNGALLVFSRSADW